MRTENGVATVWSRVPKHALKGVHEGVAYCLAVFAVLFFCLAWMPGVRAQGAQGAIEALIEADASGGFCRFSIVLPDRTDFMEYDVSTEDNVVVLRLSEPVNVDLERGIAPLAEYVLAARQNPEGTVFRFAPAVGVRVNTLTAGEHFFLDFLPRSWSGDNPSIPEDVARKLEKRAEAALALAEEKERVRKEIEAEAVLDVRGGRHPTFSRFVFSWSKPYTASFSRKDNSAILVFDKVGSYDFGPLNADLPELVEGISSKSDAGTTTIALILDPAAKVRSYVDGAEYIVDVTSDALSKDVIKLDSPLIIGALPELPESAKNVSETVSSSSGERELAVLPQTSPKDESEGNRNGQEDDTPRPLPAEAVKGAEAKPEQDTAQKGDTGRESPGREIALDADGESFERPQQSSRDHPVQQRDEKQNPETVDESTKKVQGLSTVEASINESQDALRLVFPFEEKTASAIFRRGKSVWMVFKTDDVIDVSSIESLRGDFVRSVEVIDEGKYKAVRLILPNAQLASAAIDENNWVISIGNAVIRASEPLIIKRQLSDKNGIFLNVPLAAASGDVVFEDPAVGDKIHVVVAEPPARGLLRQQNFVMLTILPSTHALAFVPENADVTARIVPDGGAIESEQPLNLSITKGLRASAGGKLATDEWYDAAFEISDSDILRPVEFAERERELIKQVVESSDEERPQRHLALAQFYIANSFAPEALASLERAFDEQPILKNKRAFVLSEAAAQLKMHRSGDALKTLSSEAYEKDQDAAVWRTIAATGKGEWASALKSAVLGRTRLSSYDLDTKQDFFLAAADAALQLKDLNNAKNYLGNLVLDNAS